MHIPPQLRCHDHRLPLVPDERTRPTWRGGNCGNSFSLVCSKGCHIPVVNNIPRFVCSANYASSFGLQWKAFQKTQLDSYTGTTISLDRLTRCLGGSLEVVQGKSVLEAGCGAGRFTEILLGAGARVFACDLSEAVEANYANCGHWPNYFVCQADILRLPALPRSFDTVLALGVIQHTPSPEVTISTLAEYVRPGGMLVIDHYTYGYPAISTRRMLRWLLIRLPPALAMAVALALTRSLLPLHKLLWSERRGMWRLRRNLRRVSIVVDYYDSYPQLGKKLLEEWAILDTLDTLTDHYKQFRSLGEIENSLASCGLIEIEAYYAGNGVEARAKRPVAGEPGDASEVERS
jgi:SAM-dependent methyltransferase